MEKLRTLGIVGLDYCGSTLVSNVLSDIIRAPFTLIGSIAVLFFINWKLSIIALSILSLHTLLTQLWIYCFTSIVGLMGWVKQLRILNDDNEKRINY